MARLVHNQLQKKTFFLFPFFKTTLFFSSSNNMQNQTPRLKHGLHTLVFSGTNRWILNSKSTDGQHIHLYSTSIIPKHSNGQSRPKQRRTLKYNMIFQKQKVSCLLETKTTPHRCSEGNIVAERLCSQCSWCWRGEPTIICAKSTKTMSTHWTI